HDHYGSWERALRLDRFAGERRTLANDFPRTGDTRLAGGGPGTGQSPVAPGLGPLRRGVTARGRQGRRGPGGGPSPGGVVSAQRQRHGFLDYTALGGFGASGGGRVYGAAAEVLLSAVPVLRAAPGGGGGGTAG